MDFVSRVEQEIRTERLFEEGDSIVVAVSGGPDSVALLHVLFALSKQWKWRLSVAHLNHGFRIKESEQEEVLVSELAAKLGLPIEVARLDVPEYIKETGKNSQSAARELRYRFLHKAAALFKANRIALAHHADDQAETVLMRLLRGTGPSGLTGIPKRRMEKEMELVRPLLRIYKTEILDYCHTQQLPYSIDSSNLERKYVRNELRLDLIPSLQKQYNEQLPQALNRLSEMMTAEDDYMELQARALLVEGVAKESDSVKWSRKWFMGLHVALQRRLIKLILNYLGLDPDSIDFLKLEKMRDGIVSVKPSNMRLNIGGSLILTREYDRIYLHNYVVPPISFSYSFESGQNNLEIPEIGVSLECTWLDRELFNRAAVPLSDNPYTAWFDAEQLQQPIEVRSRRDGDRMSLFGLNGSKKVKDIFIDAKIPPSLRAKVPIITDGQGRIIWLSGVRRSSLSTVTDSTKLILYMKLHMPEGLSFSMSR
ncbi:tRNA lysidine(34) synthetase TilS [Paenibacillus sp. LMG 31456]|uniref:tRNA(Ile)-lysidine synthase n=1 Tax=Paenibacillus foliorum TaxID=2654974 RepID=A0A972K4P8_9BACL|nr:tRNA lysidine(34) synthetase TilS [Paenibacillus foliorum]NOU98305.1 tRNA lysidine(34) synthetase TilS [Paenibacillus foliorum]